MTPGPRVACNIPAHPWRLRKEQSGSRGSGRSEKPLSRKAGFGPSKIIAARRVATVEGGGQGGNVLSFPDN